MAITINVQAEVHVHGEDERKAECRHREIVNLLHGLIDSAGDKEKMVALAGDIKAQREALAAAIPAGNIGKE